MPIRPGLLAQIHNVLGAAAASTSTPRPQPRTFTRLLSGHSSSTQPKTRARRSRSGTLTAKLRRSYISGPVQGSFPRPHSPIATPNCSFPTARCSKRMLESGSPESLGCCTSAMSPFCPRRKRTYAGLLVRPRGPRASCFLWSASSTQRTCLLGWLAVSLGLPQT
jgi:hypothetical protein